jgi:DNA-directed RNA polymerase beta subunit
MGEMEKDAFLAHGAAFSLDDRSRIASDAHNALVCTKCGHIGDSKEETLRQMASSSAGITSSEPCRMCDSNDSMVLLPSTYCYTRLLVPEIATCGIKVVHKFSGVDDAVQEEQDEQDEDGEFEQLEQESSRLASRLESMMVDE